MAERVAVDPAVDELRRKARRRLVGAIVLALAAAVILPMLLEKEPRPLGEDVAVRIPPVDDSKFVNRLSPGASAKSKDAAVSPAPPLPPAAATAAAPDAPAPSPSVTSTTATPEAASSGSATPEKNAPPGDTLPSPVASPDTPAKSADATKAVRHDAKAAEPAKAAKPTGGFVVQLAAFSDDKGANALASKLKRNGYPAFTEPVQTSRGTLYRVRVGSYPSRDAAADARNKLKGDGYAGIVASVH